MNNEIKENNLIFGDAIILPNNEENWQFILADRTYTLDAPTEVIISRMLKQLLAEQAKNSELDSTLKILKINHKLTISELNNEQAKNKKLVEALKFISSKINTFEMDWKNGCLKSPYQTAKNIAQQALNEVNNAK